MEQEKLTIATGKNIFTCIKTLIKENEYEWSISIYNILNKIDGTFTVPGDWGWARIMQFVENIDKATEHIEWLNERQRSKE